MVESQVMDLSSLNLPDAEQQPRVMDLSSLNLPDVPESPDMPNVELAENPLSADAPGMWDQNTYFDIPPAPRSPFRYASRPPERLSRENAPQFMQDVWEKTAPLSTAGPLRSHPLRPDLRVVVPGVGSGEWSDAKLPAEPIYALPNEASGFFEEAEGGARQAFANAAALVASNVLRLANALMPRQEGENDEEYARRPTRADIYSDTYNSIAEVLNVKNLAAPGSFSEALGGLAFETLPLATGIGEATLPAWTTGLAAKFPSLAAKIAPIVNGALTFGAQCALEPENPLRQAAAGATVGAILGATTPAGRFTGALIGEGLGYGQEAFANPNSIIEDRARNAILMGTFGCLRRACAAGYRGGDALRLRAGKGRCARIVAKSDPASRCWAGGGSDCRGYDKQTDRTGFREPVRRDRRNTARRRNWYRGTSIRIAKLTKDWLWGSANPFERTSQAACKRHLWN
ncbi:MAG: hypothetical protein ABSG91_06210 [Syntrophobacteraceae bacterium]